MKERSSAVSGSWGLSATRILSPSVGLNSDPLCIGFSVSYCRHISSTLVDGEWARWTVIGGVRNPRTRTLGGVSPRRRLQMALLGHTPILWTHHYAGNIGDTDWSGLGHLSLLLQRWLLQWRTSLEPHGGKRSGSPKQGYCFRRSQGRLPEDKTKTGA